MAEVSVYTHSRLHLERRDFAGNFHEGRLVAGAALTAEDVNSSKTSKFKTGTAISEDLVPGSSTSSVNPWFEAHQVRWKKQAEKAVAEFEALAGGQPKVVSQLRLGDQGTARRSRRKLFY